jgi:hypothetical protein
MWMTFKKLVSFAIEDLRAIIIQRREPVHVHVGLNFSVGLSAVYNLSVEDAEEYFANGILVHNCRYLIMAVLEDETAPLPKEKPGLTIYNEMILVQMLGKAKGDFLEGEASGYSTETFLER